jgi:Arc/MetJ-type ribon-helix-helix transcriptional regulator
MTAERVTVSLPPDVAREARELVAAGAEASMSALVTDALRDKLDRRRALAELEAVLPGGRPPADVLAAVRRDLGLTRAHDPATA